MSDTGERGTEAARILAGVRLAIGLAQGLALYGLYRAADAQLWPATHPLIFAPLALVAFLVPLIAIQAAGNIRLRTLLPWLGAATAILAALAVYDRWRIALAPLEAGAPVATIRDDGLPSFALFFFCAVGLFIAQSLIAAADRDRKFIARYDAYFDAAWKLGVQLALALVFVGVFWGVLWLGAGLFDLINLKFLSDLLDHAWFSIPATALATAGALHLTDVRSRLVAGIRTVVLVLLSWLLPLMALLAVGFLASLLFTGLEPLWKTRSAAALLLTAAATLVFLINAAWQDGSGEHTPPALLRLGATAAALVLVPLVALAAYALALRVGQHGWSEDRIYAFACMVVAACYAFGYGAVVIGDLALRRGWLTDLAPVNIATSFIVLGVLAALFSPAADPLRIAVDSQVARLQSGAVSPDKFDYAYLRWQGGRFGRAALTRLAATRTGAGAASIRTRAQEAMAARHERADRAPTAADIAARIHVYPPDHLLPQSLLRQDWRKDAGGYVPACLSRAGGRCDAFPAELNGAPPDQYVFVTGEGDGWSAVVLGQDDFGHWSVVGRLNGPHCKAALDAMRAGQYAVVAPVPQYRAIEAGDRHFEVVPVYGPDACSK